MATYRWRGLLSTTGAVGETKLSNNEATTVYRSLGRSPNQRPPLVSNLSLLLQAVKPELSDSRM